MAQYNITTGGCWSGVTRYAFMHDGRVFFTMSDFHSELHAKREAAQWLATIGIHVEPEEIGVVDDGTL